MYEGSQVNGDWVEERGKVSSLIGLWGSKMIRIRPSAKQLKQKKMGLVIKVVGGSIEYKPEKIWYYRG